MLSWDVGKLNIPLYSRTRGPVVSRTECCTPSNYLFIMNTSKRDVAFSLVYGFTFNNVHFSLSSCCSSLERLPSIIIEKYQDPLEQPASLQPDQASRALKSFISWRCTLVIHLIYEWDGDKDGWMDGETDCPKTVSGKRRKTRKCAIYTDTRDESSDLPFPQGILCPQPWVDTVVGWPPMTTGMSPVSYFCISSGQRCQPSRRWDARLYACARLLVCTDAHKFCPQPRGQSGTSGQRGAGWSWAWGSARACLGGGVGGWPQ